jgi:hypothetical protein
MSADSVGIGKKCGERKKKEINKYLTVKSGGFPSAFVIFGRAALFYTGFLWHIALAEWGGWDDNVGEKNRTMGVVCPRGDCQ